VTPDALAALHALCFSHPRPWSAKEFASVIDSPGVFLRTDPHGFVLGRALAGEAELLTLAVHPDARRRGVGRDLLLRFETTAREREASEALLEVAEDNMPARALYAGGGYVQAGRRPGYYVTLDGPRIDALILRKALIPRGRRPEIG